MSVVLRATLRVFLGACRHLAGNQHHHWRNCFRALTCLDAVIVSIGNIHTICNRRHRRKRRIFQAHSCSKLVGADNYNVVAFIQTTEEVVAIGIGYICSYNASIIRVSTNLVRSHIKQRQFYACNTLFV